MHELQILWKFVIQVAKEFRFDQARYLNYCHVISLAPCMGLSCGNRSVITLVSIFTKSGKQDYGLWWTKLWHYLNVQIDFWLSSFKAIKRWLAQQKREKQKGFVAGEKVHLQQTKPLSICLDFKRPFYYLDFLVHTHVRIECWLCG